MSWSITAVGKPAAVAMKVQEDLSNVTCSEPEESIKKQVASVIATALAAFPADSAVRIEASGSQSSWYDPRTHAAVPGHVNSLSVRVEPLYGFVS